MILIVDYEFKYELIVCDSTGDGLEPGCQRICIDGNRDLRSPIGSWLDLQKRVCLQQFQRLNVQKKRLPGGGRSNPVTYQQWRSESLLQCKDSLKDRTTSDVQHASRPAEMPCFRNHSKRFELLLIDIHILESSPCLHDQATREAAPH
ncbi:hypothetical protein [Paraburkholderia haematera]|jgi:hypothetical protein|uniref:Uncharacterized protein n=1 Tax=Paraburkholderia haematera TaxID=2793077 RepID=A0ABM8SGY4_9BURK|nr:hypothetical protein [Paraburkholderia haematera]CAE6809004.1 hypothetical protein R69888_05571 [Paraburkholderia haematera]